MDRTVDYLTAARAEALFVSDLSAWAGPTRADVVAAIRQAVRMRGGTRGCAGEVAAAYGDHPEVAAPRMRWARGMVDSVFAGPSAHQWSWPGPTKWAADVGSSSAPAAGQPRGETCMR